MEIRRAVVDTNVLISAALNARGSPANVVRQLLQYARLVFSPATFAELETRLWRPKFDRYVTLEARKLLLHDFSAASDWVEALEGPTSCRDPADDKFIIAALAARVDLLISGDKDLLDLHVVDGIPIVNPAQALRRMQAWQDR